MSLQYEKISYTTTYICIACQLQTEISQQISKRNIQIWQAMLLQTYKRAVVQPIIGVL